MKIMKHSTFLMGFLFIGTAIFAQDSTVNLKKLEIFKLPDFKIKKVPFKYSEQFGTLISPVEKMSLKPGITILQLDNMPCYVPDVATVSKMPNHQFNGIAVKIPNKITVIK